MEGKAFHTIQGLILTDTTYPEALKVLRKRHGKAVGAINLGQSIAKIIIIILSLRVDASKNKNIDHRGKETCAYKNDHISSLCDSTMSSAVNFCFLSILLQPKIFIYFITN